MKSPFFPTISVGKRFFVFNSLVTNELLGADETLAAANNILSSGAKQLYNINTDPKDSETAIEQALNILEMAYKTELATEKNFYEERLLKNKNIPEEYRQQIAKLITDESFDYLTFINILKEIELGKEQWKKQISEIKQQAVHFNEALTQFQTKIGKFDMRVHGDEAVRTLIGQLYKDQNITYREQNSSWQQALHRSKTFGNAALGSLRSEDSAALIKLINDNIDIIMQKDNIELNLPQKIGFTTEMALTIAQEVYDIQKNQETSIIDLDIAKQLISLLENTEPTTIDNLHVENLRRKAQMLLDNLDILEQQGKTIMPEASSKVSYNNNKNDIIGLTKDLRIRLGKILEDKTLQELAEKNFTGKEGKKNKQKFIERLKRIIKEDGGKDINNNNIIKQLTKAQLVKHINEILNTRGRLKISTETEFASARSIHQLFNSSSTLKDLVIAGINGKADSIHIGTIYGETYLPSNIEQEITTYISQIYEETYEAAYKETIASLQSMNYRLPTASKSEQEYQKLFNSSNAYSSYADNIANARANEAAMNALKEQILNLTNINDNDKEKLFNLSSMFKIENSVKYARYYFNDYGFHGGSLGASLVEQLMNLNNIMAIAGLNNRLDIDWLTFAILNAGDGMIGRPNRSAIEDYLSGFAAILMSRTGGELAQQVKNNLNTRNNTISTTDTLRLYTLQSLYVPSSYILKTTYDALVQAYQLLQTNISTPRGSQVLIINPVQEESDKVNTHTYDQRGKAWYETAAANFGKVRLEERLMTGFLDILEQLETIMNKTI